MKIVLTFNVHYIVKGNFVQCQNFSMPSQVQVQVQVCVCGVCVCVHKRTFKECSGDQYKEVCVCVHACMHARVCTPCVGQYVKYNGLIT